VEIYTDFKLQSEKSIKIVRVFGQFVWLGVGSGKMALSHPAHQRVTQAAN